MGNKTPDLNKIGFRKERPDYSGGYVARYSNSYRVGFDGTYATPEEIPATQCLTFDKLDGNLDPIPEPLLKKEVIYGIGAGRNADRIVEMGYETVEQAITVNAQTGIWLYYVLGGYSADGTALSSPLTDTVASVTGTAVVLTDSRTATENQYRGKLLVMTSGDYDTWVFVITANAAASGAALQLTVNTPPPAGIATCTCKIVESPYTHTIFEPSAAGQCQPTSKVWLPSLIVHIETSDGTTAKYRDLIGCLVKSLKITLENGAKIMFEVTLLIPKSIVGVVQTAYPTYAYSGDATRGVLSDNTDAFLTWEHIDRTNSYFKYNNNAIFGSTANWLNECYKIEITIDNMDLEIKNVLGDPYPYKVLVGKRDYTIVMSYYPNSNEITENTFDATAYNTLYALKQTALASYDGNIAMLIRFGRSATDYISLTFSSLYVDDYPDKLITIEDKEVSIDCTLKNAPAEGSVTAGTLAVTVVDDRNPSYYGDT